MNKNAKRETTNWLKDDEVRYAKCVAYWVLKNVPGVTRSNFREEFLRMWAPFSMSIFGKVIKIKAHIRETQEGREIKSEDLLQRAYRALNSKGNESERPDVITVKNKDLNHNWAIFMEWMNVNESPVPPKMDEDEDDF